MKEKDFQILVANELIKRGARCYSYNKNIGNGRFKPVGHFKKFDILMFHNCVFLPSPLALELKSDGRFNTITKALNDQINKDYVGKEFECKTEKWKGTPSLFLLFTFDAYNEAVVYAKYYKEASNFFIERFTQRFTYGGMGILYKSKGEWWVASANKYINIFTNESIQITDGSTDFRGRKYD